MKNIHSNFFFLDGANRLVAQQSKIDRDPTLEILSVDSYRQKGIFLVVANTKLLLMSTQKQVLFQITFNFPIDSAIFINDSCDILISHENKVIFKCFEKGIYNFLLTLIN